MDPSNLLKMLLMFAALGAVLYYGARVAGSVSRKIPAP